MQAALAGLTLTHGHAQTATVFVICFTTMAPATAELAVRHLMHARAALGDL